MSSGRIAQHRNYNQIMARHEKEVRIKKIIRIFMYFLIIAFIIVLFVIVQRVSANKKSPGKENTSLVIPADVNLKGQA
jgi:large-conductance mechanosensitive channel